MNGSSPNSAVIVRKSVLLNSIQFGGKELKHIILFCPGNLNFGDNAILFTWLEFFDSFLCRDDEVTILGCETSYIESLLNRFHYRIFCTSLLHHYVWKHGATETTMATCSENVLRGKDSFDEFEPMSSFLPDIFRKSDYVHILGGGILNSMWVDIQYQVKLVVSLAKKYGKKVVLTGQTIGPLDSKGEENLCGVFQDVDLCDLRDTSCVEYLKGLNNSTISTVDDVFIHLAARKGRPKNVPESICQMAKQKHINVCIQKWGSVQEAVYHKQLKELAAFLRGYLSQYQECKLYLLEFMPLDADSEMADLLLSILGEEYKTKTMKLSLPNFYPFDASRILETAELNIGTRFHMALFSLAANVPTVSFYLDEYYNRKFRGLEDLFRCRFTLPFETFGINDIWEMIDHTGEASNSSIAWKEQAKKKMVAYYNTCWRDDLSIERIRFYYYMKKNFYVS